MSIARRCTAVGASLVAAALPAVASVPAAEETHPANVILVTLDGVRFQEIFSGMDRSLAEHAASLDHPDIEASRERYWRESPEARREALMPFFWTTLAPQGIVLGNREKGGRVRVRNEILWSSPGYAEIMTGQVQPQVRDNEPVRYPYRTFLEYVRSALSLERHEVAQFGSWDGFSLIGAGSEDAFVMNGAYDPVPPPFSSEEMDYLAELRPKVMELWEESSNDVISFRIALAYLAKNRPRLLWLALGQSDDWSHANRYDRLLDYLHLADGLLEELWTTLESLDSYRGRTTLVITTDHGRGRTPEDWTEHDASVPGSEDIWIAVIGPQTPDVGEVAPADTVYQGDIAATVLQFFELDYRDFNPSAGPPIPGSKSSE